MALCARARGMRVGRYVIAIALQVSVAVGPANTQDLRGAKPVAVKLVQSIWIAPSEFHLKAIGGDWRNEVGCSTRTTTRAPPGCLCRKETCVLAHEFVPGQIRFLEKKFDSSSQPETSTR